MAQHAQVAAHSAGERIVSRVGWLVGRRGGSEAARVAIVVDMDMDKDKDKKDKDEAKRAGSQPSCFIFLARTITSPATDCFQLHRYAHLIARKNSDERQRAAMTRTASSTLAVAPSAADPWAGLGNHYAGLVSHAAGPDTPLRRGEASRHAERQMAGSDGASLGWPAVQPSHNVSSRGYPSPAAHSQVVYGSGSNTASRSTHSSPAPVSSRAMAARLDQEGRFASHESPPPPPGASPSLLRPTPGRVAANASNWFATEGTPLARSKAAGVALSSSSPNDLMAPPPPPKLVYRADTAVDEGAPPDRGLRSASAAASKESSPIKLSSWFLTFTATSKAGTIDASAAHLSHWIIVTGTRQHRRSPEDQLADATEQWHSSLITERVSATCVRTGSGKVYELVGPAHQRVMCKRKGFSRGMSLAFGDGFPHNWVALLVGEASRRGLVTDTGDGAAESSKSDVSPSKIRKFRRESIGAPHRTAGNQEDKPGFKCKVLSPPDQYHDLFQSCRVSMGSADSATQGGNRTLSRAKTPKEVKKTKSIPRELRNLSKTGFGRLLVVESAIMEELDNNARARRSQRHSMPAHIEAAVQAPPATPATSHAVAPLAAPLTSPRSSSRKRVSASRWWEVLSQKDEKVLSSSPAPLSTARTAQPQNEKRRIVRKKKAVAIAADAVSSDLDGESLVTHGKTKPPSRSEDDEDDDDFCEVGDVPEDTSDEVLTSERVKRRKYQSKGRQMFSKQQREASTRTSEEGRSQTHATHDFVDCAEFDATQDKAVGTPRQNSDSPSESSKTHPHASDNEVETFDVEVARQGMVQPEALMPFGLTARSENASPPPEDGQRQLETADADAVDTLALKHDHHSGHCVDQDLTPLGANTGEDNIARDSATDTKTDSGSDLGDDDGDDDLYYFSD